MSPSYYTKTKNGGATPPLLTFRTTGETLRVVDDSILCWLRRATPAEKGRFTGLKLRPTAFYHVGAVVERLLIVLTRLFGFVYVKFAK